MDSIDITDSAFSLDIPDVNRIIVGGNNLSTDNTMFIYIGAAILIVLIAVFIYKFYVNKQGHNDLDCTGGFCTMKNTSSEYD